MDAEENKSKIKKFFTKCAKESWGKFIWYLKWSLILLVGYVILVFVYFSLPTGWQDGIAINAKNIFNYANSIAKEFSDYLSSVFTPERMKRFDYQFHLYFAEIFFGLMVVGIASIVFAVIHVFAAELLKIKRLSAVDKVLRVLNIVFSLCAGYFAAMSQPVARIAEKFALFLAH